MAINPVESYLKANNKTPSQLTENDLDIILNDPNNRNYFSNVENFKRIIENLILHKLDPKVKEDLYITKYSIDVMEDENLINDLFRKYRRKLITRTEIFETIDEYFTSSDPFFVVLTSICVLMTLFDYKLQEKEEIIKSSLGKIKEILSGFSSIEKTYTLQSNIMDLVYNLREKYFEAYDVDLFEDDYFEKHTIEMNRLEEETIMQEIPEIPVKPEEMGFIDITKLKKNHKEKKDD